MAPRPPLPRHPSTSRGACRQRLLRHKLRQAPHRTFRLRPRRQSPRPWRPWSQRPRPGQLRSLSAASRTGAGWSKKTHGWLPQSRSWAGCKTESTVRNQTRFRACSTSPSPVAQSFRPCSRWAGYGTTSAPTRPKRLTGSTTCQVLRACRPSSLWAGSKTASTMLWKSGRSKSCHTSRMRMPGSVCPSSPWDGYRTALKISRQEQLIGLAT